MAMESECFRDGHGREVGLIHFNGHTFAALGATVQGRHVTGYIGKGDTLRTWCGRVMLGCRSERCGEYRTPEGDNDAFGIYWHLTGGRAIVGYALGEGMLFRGELVDRHDTDTPEDICRAVKAECERWLQIDQDDYDQREFEADQEAAGDGE